MDQHDRWATWLAIMCGAAVAAMMAYAVLVSFPSVRGTEKVGLPAAGVSSTPGARVQWAREERECSTSGRESASGHAELPNGREDGHAASDELWAWLDEEKVSWMGLRGANLLRHEPVPAEKLSEGTVLVFGTKSTASGKMRVLRHVGRTLTVEVVCWYHGFHTGRFRLTMQPGCHYWLDDVSRSDADKDRDVLWTGDELVPQRWEGEEEAYATFLAVLGKELWRVKTLLNLAETKAELEDLIAELEKRERERAASSSHSAIEHDASYCGEPAGRPHRTGSGGVTEGVYVTDEGPDIRERSVPYGGTYVGQGGMAWYEEPTDKRGQTVIHYGTKEEVQDRVYDDVARRRRNAVIFGTPDPEDAERRRQEMNDALPGLGDAAKQFNDAWGRMFQPPSSE